ncbi:HAMP domain-containing sensor histidine kinase [Flammeovirgaceae bacterium SG7u.111]|nr:HAMP domain-containing sensor histidine kinase [Flammeovirgaceae bacterium SG7u.132]WPO36907.1 HAMP domain-containing sensor histidine kinase [Flammeovirgaceae bacterium SG7u.111]
MEMLVIEILLLSCIIIFLYHQKEVFGLALVFILIGSNQFFQTLLSSNLYVQIFNDYYYSPGSVVLFSSSIFTILLIYIKEGVHSTRTLIYGILISNITLTLLSFITSYTINSESTFSILSIPKEIFEIDMQIFIIGTITLFVDSFLIIIIFEFVLLKVKNIKIFLAILVSIISVLYFDLVIFSFFSFWGNEGFEVFFIGNLIGKSIAGVLYSLMLYAYLVYIDQSSYLKKLEISKDVKDIFSIVTYRERYEFLKKEKDHIEEMKNSLIESNKNKDKFFSIISHDLKSPFHAILSFLNLTQANFDSMSRDNVKKNLALIQKSFTNAFDLLNNLLDWSRIQMDRVQFNPTPFCINDLIDKCINNLSYNAENKNISVLFHSSENYHVFADLDMINSVISNLLSNAIKFTNTGGMIIISIGYRDKATFVKVQDNGMGIEKEVIDKLFRLDTVYTSYGTNKESGTGLGLILSEEFIKKNNGNIFVESELGKGSTFTFTLPQFLKDDAVMDE